MSAGPALKSEREKHELFRKKTLPGKANHSEDWGSDLRGPYLNRRAPDDSVSFSSFLRSFGPQPEAVRSADRCGCGRRSLFQEGRSGMRNTGSRSPPDSGVAKLPRARPEKEPRPLDYGDRNPEPRAPRSRHLRSRAANQITARVADETLRRAGSLRRLVRGGL